MERLLYILVFVFTFTLIGCSTMKPGEFLEGFEMRDNTAQINACRTWVKEKEYEERRQYDKLQSQDMSYALMHRETMSMVKEVFGKSKDVCSPGTNEMDAYIAYVREKGATDRVIAQEVGSGVKTLAIVGGASYVGGKLVDNVGDKVSGDQTISGRDGVKTKGDVSVDGTNTQTTTTTSDKISQVNTASTDSPQSTSKVNPPPAAPATPVTPVTPVGTETPVVAPAP